MTVVAQTYGGLAPSTALAARRDEIRRLFADAGLPSPLVFGSVARGEDTSTSDLDLLVDFTDEHDITDLLRLEEELSQLLGVRAELVDARGDDVVNRQARAEAVPLRSRK